MGGEQRRGFEESIRVCQGAGVGGDRGERRAHAIEGRRWVSGGIRSDFREFPLWLNGKEPN